MKYRTILQTAEVWKAEITEFPETVRGFLEEIKGQFGEILVTGRENPINADFGNGLVFPEFDSEVLDAKIKWVFVSDSWGFNRYLIEIY